MADDKRNRLLSGQGSVEEQKRLAEGASYEKLREAAPYSVQAQLELERRGSAEILSIARRALANSEQANRLSKQADILAGIGIIISIVAIVTAIILAGRPP